MAHTPAPWSVSGDAIVARESGYVVMWVYAAAKCGREGDDYYSCKPPSPVITVRWRSPEDLALALAAPDLLAALISITDHLERVGDNRKDAEFINAARAAIARAEGKS